MKLKTLLPAMLVALAASFANAQTGYNITGGLSNFDCRNECDDPCDEMEIEIEDIEPHDVVHTYRNGNYGSPTVTRDPNQTFTLISYRSPQHPTPVGVIEHFGVSLRQLGPTNAIRVRWYRNGQPATVNGVVPNPNGSGVVPATQPLMPTIISEMDMSGGNGSIGVTVTNNDPTQSIWIKRRAAVYAGSVTLEALMTDNPVVESTLTIDTNSVRLLPLQTVSYSNDLLEIEDFQQSVVFTAEYAQNLHVGGPFGDMNVPGPILGHVMTSSTAQQEGMCELFRPVIIEQPISVEQSQGTPVDLRVNAEGNDMDLTYQWYKEGQPISDNQYFSGTDTDNISIEPLIPATEGFYQVEVVNNCGRVMSQSALVFITGHNTAPPRGQACDSIDFNNDDSFFDPQDIDAFLSVYSEGPCVPEGDPCNDIDFNNDGSLYDPCDIDAFLLVFSEGPCTDCGL